MKSRKTAAAILVIFADSGLAEPKIKPRRLQKRGHLEQEHVLKRETSCSRYAQISHQEAMF